MNLRQAAQQALEALEHSETTVPYEGFGIEHREAVRLHAEAITALKQALAEPEPRNQCGETCERAKLCATCAKALAEPEQEPVAWRVQRSDGQYELYFLKASAERAAAGYIKRPPVEPLYTAPTPRKPLTDEEIGKIAGDCLDAWSCARAIERAHGIGEQT